MGKYLETKPNSLESAVLEAVSAAQQAAIAISKKEKEQEEELSAKQKKIDLNKNGKVDGDDLKKLRAKKEEVSLVNKAAEHITNMWKEAAKVGVDKKEEKHDNGEAGGKTMTGKPMSKVEVNPKEEEK